jgi:hypothetical protein
MPWCLRLVSVCAGGFDRNNRGITIPAHLYIFADEPIE